MTLEQSKRKEFVSLCFFYWSILVLKRDVKGQRWGDFIEPVEAKLEGGML